MIHNALFVAFASKRFHMTSYENVFANTNGKIVSSKSRPPLLTNSHAVGIFVKGLHCSFSFETTLLIAFPTLGHKSDVWNLLLVFLSFHLVAVL